MDPQSVRTHKVRKIFRQFDINQDGRLNRQEMAALVVAVNPRVRFSDEQIGAILDEVFRTYSDYIVEAEGGLSFEGLLRTYDDGAGDVDRDFDALRLDLDSGDSEDPLPAGHVGTSKASSITDERAESVQAARRQNLAPWASSPNNGIIYDGTWGLIEDLDIIIKRLEAKWASKRKKDATNADALSEGAWSRDLGLSSGPLSSGDASKRNWEELGQDYLNFRRDLAEIQQKANSSKTQNEVFDAHMAIGRGLYEHALCAEAFTSFKKASEVKPPDPRPHFRLGNTLYCLGKHAQAKDCFVSALDAAEITGVQWNSLLPQIHVNLGIALEAQGMLLSASEHYKEAAIREPKHYRALKLLGSALYGVGEYRAAEKALMEAIFLKSDYADAHCDLGSTLHAMGDDERAIHEFQKALDLKPDHMDALYNLGGLLRDMGRFQRAAEMYSRVIALQPGHWRSQLNRAVALLGAGEIEEAKKAFKEAFKMTNRVELYDAIKHVKYIEKKPRGSDNTGKKAEAALPSSGTKNTKGSVVQVEASQFRQASAKTTPRQWLTSALEIRRFQRHTRLSRCDVSYVRKEFSETQLSFSSSGGSGDQKSVRKEELEKILRRLLHFLKPDTFQGAVKSINGRILGVLDGTGSGRVDIGMFFALVAPVCAGPLDKRKRTTFDALVWRASKGTGVEIAKADAILYMRLLRAIFLPAQGGSGIMEVHGTDEQATISFPEFVEMFDDHDWGFGIIHVLVRLEANDHVRHNGLVCAVCCYRITGPWFKETSNFTLCAQCYSEGKVPSSIKKGEYYFREYNNDMEAMKDKLRVMYRRSGSAHDA